MNSPAARNKLSPWLLLTSLAGLALGLVVEDESFAQYSSTDAIIVSIILLGTMVLFGLVERVGLGLARGLQKVGGKPGPPMAMSRMTFFRYTGWFFCFLGLGQVTCGIWRESAHLWHSLGLLGGGLGTLLGLQLRQRLFGKTLLTE